MDHTSTASPGTSLITSYDLLPKIKGLWEQSWDALILDESHFLKSTDAKRSKLVMGKDGLIHRANRTWLLSGTPMPSHPGELWIMLYAFGLTTLPYDAFVSRYCETRQTPFGLKIIGADSRLIPELRSLLAKCTLRRTMAEVFPEMPPVTFEEVIVEGQPIPLDLLGSFIQYVFPVDKRAQLQAELEMQRAETERRLLIDDIDAAGFQSTATYQRWLGCCKIEPVAEMVKHELLSRAYDKIVIFALHRDVIENLRDRLKDFGAVTVYGGTPDKKRQRNLDAFQNKDNCRVIIGNIRAMGTAVPLHSADHVLMVERDWVPGNNAQAIARVRGPGKNARIYVRSVSLADTVEERLGKVIDRRTQDAIKILG